MAGAPGDAPLTGAAGEPEGLPGRTGAGLLDGANHWFRPPALSEPKPAMPAAAACFPGGETSGVFRLGGANHWRRSSRPAPVAQAGAAHIAPEPASAASRQRQQWRQEAGARCTRRPTRTRCDFRWMNIG
ncbi:hypothetical protein L519_3286 [Bordetella bronchiseptica MBORD678]|nr:hypothetical protein L511_3318 [Bordetella bronchiseptica MBORD595]KDC69211.1 hypothetical protein L512_3360 [Bordetella bronchiseptica MBORD624]KDD59648.1 hypothetical protein L536_3288 [Bordetella bronchiseptica SO10328]KDD82541.1 hypothetical protein L519_3286 [Bordetella bronchiseptica MBORD678]